MKIIFDYNRTIYNPEQSELYAGVFDLLKSISEIHQLYLITQAEDSRHSEIQGLGIDSFFKEILYVDEKRKEHFEKVGGIEKAIVVGDRISGEITLGNQLNHITIWVRQGKHAEVFPEQPGEYPTHTVEKVTDILEIIKSYE